MLDLILGYVINMINSNKFSSHFSYKFLYNKVNYLLREHDIDHRQHSYIHGNMATDGYKFIVKYHDYKAPIIRQLL